jgi:hypothetical protein
MRHIAIRSVVAGFILTLIIGTPGWTLGRGHHIRHHGGAPGHVGFSHGFHRPPFPTPSLFAFRPAVFPPPHVFLHPLHGGFFFARGWVPRHWVILNGVWIWVPGYWAIVDP